MTASARLVLLFGSQARGDTHRDSDYDFIVVSPHFQGTPPIGRSAGLHDLWWEAGGQGAIDLFCLTPGEFDRARDEVNLVSTVLPEAVDLLGPPPAG